MSAGRKKKAQAPPTPVEGEVIGVSTLAMIGMMIVCGILTLVGLGALAVYFAVAGTGVWVLVLGLVLLVFGPAGIAMGVIRMGAKERLILGADRFQVVNRIKGEDVVMIQIPYANIAGLVFESGDQSNRIGIELADLTDPETYERDPTFESTKSVRGNHYVLDGGYTEALGTIYEMLKGRIDAQLG